MHGETDSQHLRAREGAGAEAGRRRACLSARFHWFYRRFRAQGHARLECAPGHARGHEAGEKNAPEAPRACPCARKRRDPGIVACRVASVRRGMLVGPGGQVLLVSASSEHASAHGSAEHASMHGTGGKSSETMHWGMLGAGWRNGHAGRELPPRPGANHKCDGRETGQDGGARGSRGRRGIVAGEGCRFPGPSRGPCRQVPRQ